MLLEKNLTRYACRAVSAQFFSNENCEWHLLIIILLEKNPTKNEWVAAIAQFVPNKNDK